MEKDLSSALASLMAAAGQTTRQNKVLQEKVERAPIPPRSASAVSRPAGSGSGGSIASPLVETDYADRTFHAEITITSTDGLLTLKLKPVKAIKFKDANNAAVTIEFKAPA